MSQMPDVTMLYIATILAQNMHHVILVDGQAEKLSPPDVGKRLLDTELVIINSASMTFRSDVKIVRHLKEANPQLKAIMFGQFPTFFPEVALREDVDFVVRKEPEYAIKDLTNALENGGSKKIPGVGFKEDGTIFIHPEPYPWGDLNTLPFPDRSFLPEVEYFSPIVSHRPWTAAQTSRGCYARCTFCTVPYFSGRTWRVRSAESVVDEMEILSEKYKTIWFRDETFTFSKKRVRDICRLIRERNLDVFWICNARVGTINKDLLKLMKHAGLEVLKFGVESGNQLILDKIRKDVTVEEIHRNFRWCSELGIKTHAHFILGCPGETEETLEDTLKLAKEINPTTVTFNVMTPLPGSSLYDEVKRLDPLIGDGSQHTFSEEHSRGFRNELFCDFTSAELSDIVRRAYRDFYFRSSYFLRQLKRIGSWGEFRILIRAGAAIMLFGVVGET